MKSKLFLLSNLMLVLLVGMVSASGVLEITNTSEIPSTINHGEEITIELDVTYTGDAIDKTITWSGENPSDDSFWTLPTTTIFTKGIPTQVTFKFSVPQNSQPGTINAKLRADGAGQDPDNFDFSIEVNEDKSLAVSSETIESEENTTTIIITNTGNIDLENIELTASEEDFGITLSPTSISLIAGQTSDPITVTIARDDVDFGISTITITANDTIENVIATGEIDVETSFCEYQDLGYLDIEVDEITVTEGFGEDDSDGYWYPFDEIEVELFIESNTYDIDDIEVEWALYTESGYKITDDTETDFNLDEDEDKTITISFKLDNKLSKFEDEDKLVFYVKATGEIDDRDAPDDLDNEKICAEASPEEMELITDDTFVVIDNVQITETVQCGTELQITADVWNIGDDNQDDVYVTIYNHELGINEQIEIGDINSFDSEKLDALINIPADAEEKWYTLTAWVYDEDNDVYENKEDELAEFEILIKVEGNCIESIVSVYANLESGGKAGQELTVKAIITNLGNEFIAYNLRVSGEGEWASSADLSQSTILLDVGESKEVLITFDVNADALGEQLFNIEVLEGEDLILEQPVSVSIEKAGFSFPGITGNVISKDNWYLWGIGALNVILVLIIISIAVRVMKK